ncbi:8698_t:CDS:2, partial [Gigaspora rosea]
TVKQLVNSSASPHFFQLLSDEDFNNFLILIANGKPVYFNLPNKIDDILDIQRKVSLTDTALLVPHLNPKNTLATENQKYKLAQNKITYLSASKIQGTYDVSVETLRQWAASRKVAIVKTPGGKRLYSITDIYKAFGNDRRLPESMQKAKVCYARVSLEHQQELAEDLLSIVTVFVVRDIMDYALLPIAKEEKIPPKRFKSSKKEVMKLPAGKIGTARWTYNRCLIAVEKEGVKRKKKDLRARCLNAVNFQNKTKLEWVLETPYDIRDEAMNDLLKGYATNFAANRKNFKMKFRSKKDPQQSIAILSKHW